MEPENMTCPHCGNPNCLQVDLFCFNCGNHLHNFCTNEECQLSECSAEGSGELGPEMVFCPVCGAESTFSEEGYIEKKEFTKP